MSGDGLKIISKGRPGAEAGVVRLARESGDEVEIVQNAGDGIAKADAVLLICDSVLFVCGSHECDEPGIERKAKALFDRGMYCVKAHEAWLRENELCS